MRSLRPLRPLSALLTAVLLIGALATVPTLAQKAALPASTAAAWQQKLDPGTRMLYHAAGVPGNSLWNPNRRGR